MSREESSPPRSLRVLVGVSGGIAAFKAIDIVRLLRQRGHEVRCALTRSASSSFVAPLTLEVLTGHRVYQQEYLEGDGSGDELHISLAEWADVICVAPATAHTLARLALGLADDFLATTALAHDGSLVVAPAMHSIMWDRETVTDHVATLTRRGAVVVGPTVGPLASGEVGVGRMSEPTEIVEAIEDILKPGPLTGRRVLVTGGPTREVLDPVRFLSSPSSGKMGFSIARAAAEMGAETTLVAGPVSLETPRGVQRVDVTSAEEMRSAVQTVAPHADLIVMAAAVADFRPRTVSPVKIKKQTANLDAVDLEPTVDILATLRELAPDAVIVGFAAETGDLLANARVKLESKNVDFVVANDVSRDDIGFGTDENEVVVLSPDGEIPFDRQDKLALARRLLTHFEPVVVGRASQRT